MNQPDRQLGRAVTMREIREALGHKTTEPDDRWEPCSPEWLRRMPKGACSWAPRQAGDGETVSHYHPALPADRAAAVECGCDPAPHREADGTYSHWAGCPVADAQQAAAARQERYAEAIHDAMETDLSLVDQEPEVQALFACAAEAAVALADTEQAVARCICGHPEAQHFEDACLTCDCGDYLTPGAAREAIARHQAAVKRQDADRAAVLREAATVADGIADAMGMAEEEWASRARWACASVAVQLRRKADETQPATQAGAAFVTRVLELFSLSHADAYGDLFWRVDDGEVRLYANVSDVFAWGGSDCEDITPDALPALEQAYADLKAIGGEEFTAELYAARQRGMRPQGAAYPSGTHEAWRKVSALYDMCGPERELGLGNPKAAPAHEAAVEARQDGAQTEADRIVAYRSGNGDILRCVPHGKVGLIGMELLPVTSDDLPDGGLCTYPRCGVDVLIPQEPQS